MVVFTSIPHKSKTRNAVVKFVWPFGYIDFESAAAAKAAFDSMNGQEIEGRPVKLDFASELQTPPGGDFRQGQWLGDKGRGRGGFGRGRGGGSRGGRGRGRGGFTTNQKRGIKDFKGSKKSFKD